MTLLVGAAVFIVTFGAGLIGLALHHKLAETHRSSESKDTVRLVQALIASIATLVLSLLIASASTHYRTQADGLAELASDIIVLDIALAHSGADADPARRELRAMVEAALEHRVLSHEESPIDTVRFDAFHNAIAALRPSNAAEHASQQRALDMAGRLVQGRVLLLMKAAINDVQWPFLGVLVSWLAMLFLAMGVFSRANRLIIVAIFAGAVTVGGAIFLILELEQPRVGLLRVSDRPLRFALHHLGQWPGSTPQ
jgi:hypothetical protein